MLDALTDTLNLTETQSDQRVDVWAKTIHQRLANGLNDDNIKASDRDHYCRHELKKLLKKSLDSSLLRNMLSYSPETGTPHAGVINHARKALLDLIQHQFGLMPENQPLTGVLDKFSPKRNKLEGWKPSPMTMGSPRFH